MNSTVPSPEQMTISQRRELHSLCWTFEEAWQTGQPRIEDWLNRSIEVHRDVLLHELLILEIERRNCKTDDAAIRLYLDRFPDSSSHVLNAFDVAELNAFDVAEEPIVQEGRSPCADDRRYEFIHEIARGGAGSVWRVYDRHMQRESAVKVLLHSNDNHEMRRRLENEARLAGRLQHPGIVPVHELDRLDNGRPFINMKLIEGSTLETLIKNETTERTELLEIFRSICEAVAYAHQKGIVHRDLKPSNVMVGAFNEVQVMDWGLAKDLCESANDTISSTDSTVVAPSSHQTIIGSILGTPAYMSPEQARGETLRIGKPADVFSLGAILCKIVIGVSPYQLSQHEALMAATNADLAPVLDRLARCTQADRELARLTTECLYADPSARPADAGVVLGRLDSILLGRRPGRFARRIAIVGLATAALMVAGNASRGLVSNRAVGESGIPIAPLVANTSEEQLVRVRQMMEQGEFAKTEALCRRIIQDDPTAGEAFYFQSHCFYELGRFVDAETSLRRAEELAPGTKEVEMVGRYKDFYRRLAEIERTLPESTRPNASLSVRDCLDRADFCSRRSEWRFSMTHYRNAFANALDSNAQSQRDERYRSVARFACVQLKRPDRTNADRNKLLDFSVEMLQAVLDPTDDSSPAYAKQIVSASELQPLRDAVNDPLIEKDLRSKIETILATAQQQVADSE